MTQIYLQSVPWDVVIHVLMKMDDKYLIRMRKTCKYFENSVEKYREKFSSRAEIGFSVDLMVDNDPQKMRICTQGRHPKTILQSDLVKQLSAISIKILTLTYSIHTPPEEMQRLCEAMHSLKPSCDSLTFCGGAPIDFVLEMAELISFRKSFALLVDLIFPHEYLKVICSAKNSSRFSLLMQRNQNQERIFNAIRPFKEVDLYRTSHEDFRDLIWDMYLYKGDEFHLKQVLTTFGVPFIYESPFDLEKGKMPPYTEVFDLKWVANEYRAVNAPRKIRKLEMFSKDALVVEARVTSDRLEGKIYIVDRNPSDWLNALERELDISVEEPFRRIYTEGDNHERKEIIRQSFMQKRDFVHGKNREASASLLP